MVAFLTPLLGACATSQDASSPVKVRQLLSTQTTSSGQPLVLPDGDLEVIVSIYDIAAGASLPSHRHPALRYGYVLSGKLSVTNEETLQTQIYRAGDFIIEAIDQWHHARNPGGKAAKLLVIDQVRPGQANVILRPKGER